MLEQCGELFVQPLGFKLSKNKGRSEPGEASFPSFTQQYLPKYGRPYVERIENLPVAIVIDQKKPAPNARSTVGTYTDINAGFGDFRDGSLFKSGISGRLKIMGK